VGIEHILISLYQFSPKGTIVVTSRSRADFKWDVLFIQVFVSPGFLTAPEDAHELNVCDFVFQIGDQWNKSFQVELYGIS
jgi:hypothetical protein